MGVLLSIENADFSANSISGLDSVKKVKWYMVNRKIVNNIDAFEFGLGFIEGRAWSDKDQSVLVGNKINIVRIYLFNTYRYQNLKLYKIGNGQSILIKENIVANPGDVQKGYFDVIFNEQIISEGEHLCVSPASENGGMYYARGIKNVEALQFDISTGYQHGNAFGGILLGWDIGYIYGA